MKVLNVEYLQKESFDKSFPYWALCIHWMRDWFNINLDTDWEDPMHILGICPYWKFNEFTKVEVSPQMQYQWRSQTRIDKNTYAVVMTRSATLGNIIVTPEERCLLKPYHLYLDKEFIIENPNDEPLELYLGCIQFNQISNFIEDEITARAERQKEYLEYHSHPILRDFPKRCILLTNLLKDDSVLQQIQYDLQKKYRLHKIQLECKQVNRNHFAIVNEEEYLDHFEIVYLHRGMPKVDDDNRTFSVYGFVLCS